MNPRLSIIVPVLNEAGGIAATLASLAPLRSRGHEVIVVDGGSTDGTAQKCAAMVDRIITVPRGRARQMNAGAAIACGQLFLFLHADTCLPTGADEHIARAWKSGASWGRFDVRIEGESRMFALIAACMNRRSRWTGIATGDQAIFVHRKLFETVGGFPDQPLMEDIELSTRLRNLVWPCCLDERVLTSGRRWENGGLWRTMFLMWQLRLRYWLGASPEGLARTYR